MKVAGKLFNLARKVRDIEVITSGSPRQYVQRFGVNKQIGKRVTRKMFSKKLLK